MYKMATDMNDYFNKKKKTGGDSGGGGNDDDLGEQSEGTDTSNPI